MRRGKTNKCHVLSGLKIVGLDITEQLKFGQVERSSEY